MSKQTKRPKTRAEMREYIISKLYQMDMDSEYAVRYSNHKFINHALTTITNRLLDIDATIEQHMQNWRLNRLSFVDRAILRLGTYELLHTDTPTEIVIDEMLNLTHKFSDEGDKRHVAFNNRVLENLATVIRGGTLHE